MKDKLKIRRQFLDSLKRGTGAAFLLARDNPAIDFSTQIIKGVLKNYAFDGQSEGGRGQYLYDLISLSNNKDKIREAVLRGLATEQKDTWTLIHLFDLAKIYAQKGDVELRQAIYDRFLLNPIDGCDWAGYHEILEIDRFQGLLYIAEKYGKWLAKNPDRWVDNFINQHFQDENPAINVSKELDNAAHKNPSIRVYLDTIKKTEDARKSSARETKTYSDIIDEALNSRFFRITRRKKGLTELEIFEVAKRLLMERNKTNQEKLLGAFDICKFPFNGDIILGLAKQKCSKNHGIRELAIRALTQVPQLAKAAKKVSEERRFFAQTAYEGSGAFRAM